MQTLVLYYKDDRRVIATFRFENAVVGAEALVTPGTDYLFTFKKDIFYYDSKGNIFVKEV